MVGLVLASGSPRRRELLSRLGVRFEVAPSDIDEGCLVESADDPETAAKRAAAAKAAAVARLHPGKVVLGADTIVVHGGTTLTKPHDELQARSMLRMLSGDRHQVITAVAVALDDRLEVRSERTDVWFRRLDEQLISWYLATGEAADKAGAYGIQGFGEVLVERIAGSYSNVVGLPLALTADVLNRFGIRVPGGGIDSGPR